MLLAGQRTLLTHLRRPLKTFVTPQKALHTKMAAAATSSGLGKLDASKAGLLICDVQERFRENIQDMPALIDAARRMARGADALGLPVLVTEQYPKALGHTVAELKQVLPKDSVVVDKTKFSMWVEGVQQRLQELPEITQLMLCGLETHVCVLQTTLDLIEQGYEVHVLVDAVSSQRTTDRTIAIRRLAQAGAYVSSQEMALFQLAGDSKHPAFKAISALVKEDRPDPIPSHSAL